MKLCFSILALFFLTGCPPVDEQKPEEKPGSAHEEESIDPFDLRGLLKKPIEDLPAGILNDPSWSVIPMSLVQKFASSQSLEGTWYGANFDYTYPVKEKRVYLQFRSDQSFSYGCVDLSREADARARLTTGKYSIEDGNLQLETEFNRIYRKDGVFEEEGLKSFSLYCGGHSWKKSGLTITIPLRQIYLNTMIFFKESLSGAEVFLVRK